MLQYNKRNLKRLPNNLIIALNYHYQMVLNYHRTLDEVK